MTLKKCETLSDARAEIDKVDEKIVELVALRNDYIKQIAHFKNSIEEIKSQERVSDIVSRVRAKAIELNLSPNLINDMFVRMIDEMVESEIAEFKNTKVF
ncbi:MAG: chorismate mutase [Sulfurovaceae bacterium]|nr:chorismate mutase [Sulfurovaceae bacterium]